MILGAKSEFWDLKNYELATKLERQNGAKCRLCPQKWDEKETSNTKKRV